ncbi:MAG: radical SAM protein [bacterium]
MNNTNGCDNKYIQSIHPCFNEQAHNTVGRVHLPVAIHCNIQCNYCGRGITQDKNERRPGLTSKTVNPSEAMERLTTIMKEAETSNLKVVGVAGPAEPLANEETFEVLKLVGEKFPQLIKCVSTNGLNLPQFAGRLYDLNINALTVTVNAPDEEIGAKIYEWVNWEGTVYKGEEGAKILISNQLEGIKKISRLGILIKVNTILLPGINDQGIPAVAQRVKEAGAGLFNIMQLVPANKFSHLKPADCLTMERIRGACEKIIPQFKACKRCRADAVGIPGKGDVKESRLIF